MGRMTPIKPSGTPCADMSESVAPGAFEETLSGDIRALVNHDTTLVLGRTKAGTLTLKEDTHGLWGHVAVNPNDRAAMDLYERVKRGDVDGCSFGFDILDEESEFREDGSIHWTIKKVKLYEVSCCTFPAYEETSISARKRDAEDLISRKNDAWRGKMLARIRKNTQEDSEDGNQNIDAPKEAE